MKKLCEVDEIVIGAGREFRSAGGFLAVFRCPDSVHAWLNVCPHQARSLNFAPDEFLFTGEGRLVCPHHGAEFDITSGDCLEGPCKGASLAPAPVTIKEGAVWLQED